MLKKNLVIASMILTGSLAAADPAAQYEVTITNITPGQSFTPQLVVTHPGNVRLFRLGEPAGVELEQLAEGGDTGPLGDALANVATDLHTNAVLLGPGETTSVAISGHPARGYISIAAMLIPTNDTFVALNRVKLPTAGAIVQLVPAYDAGTEANDQNCRHIPGPHCGGAGEGYSPGTNEGDEGYVHIGNGFHALGDSDPQGNVILPPMPYDWSNPVARIEVRRLY